MSDSNPTIKHFQDLVSPAYANADPTALHVRASALLARLKALNRTANAATRTHKQATADARQDMDQTHLGLQNLLYEKRHLEREIDKCRQFAYALPFSLSAPTLTPRSSIYQDVPLHSLPEFQELAPPEARTPDVLDNPHQLMLNRLSFELVERQRLDLRRKDLMVQKEELLKQSKIKLATCGKRQATDRHAHEDIQKKVDELVPPLVSPSAPTTPAPS
ncbi:Fms-interacting protein-domain-containing protein [Butyriboletus roseoflavus]|nr:Fms-interacting protein-domain-containing protein [Butyriboletus roseoflavus]